MSIAELDKVDGIGVDKKEKALHLLISDHMDWKSDFKRTGLSLLLVRQPRSMRRLCFQPLLTSG